MGTPVTSILNTQEVLERKVLATCNYCNFSMGVLNLHIGEDDGPRCPNCFSRISAKCDFEALYVPGRAKIPGPKAKKILIVLHGFHVCGAARRCLEDMNRLLELDCHVTVLAVGGGGLWTEKFRNVSHAAILLRNTNSDIPSWLRLMTQDIDEVEAHYQPAISWALREIPRRVPVTACLHTEPIGAHNDIELTRLMTRRAVRVRVPTMALIESYAKLLSDREKIRFRKKCILSPNTISLNSLDENAQVPKQILSFGEPCTRIAVVSRLDSDKFSVPLFIGTLQELSRNGLRYHVVVAGAGEEAQNVARAVTEAKLDDAVHFLGFVDDIAGIYRWCDVVFLPSWTEVMPYVALEAGAMKRPIVLPAVGYYQAHKLVPTINTRPFRPGDHRHAAMLISNELGRK